MPKSELSKEKNKMSTEELVKKVSNCSKIIGLSIASTGNAPLRHNAGFFMSSLQSSCLLL